MPFHKLIVPRCTISRRLLVSFTEGDLRLLIIDVFTLPPFPLPPSLSKMFVGLRPALEVNLLENESDLVNLSVTTHFLL
jgi:hypothetical protein